MTTASSSPKKAAAASRRSLQEDEAEEEEAEEEDNGQWRDERRRRAKDEKEHRQKGLQCVPVGASFTIEVNGAQQRNFDGMQLQGRSYRSTVVAMFYIYLEHPNWKEHAGRLSA